MNEHTENSLFEAVSASKAGREVDAGVVRASVRWALERFAPKDAEKAAKARLHQLYGSYVGLGWLKRARPALEGLERGSLDGREVAERLMALHGSTRERLAHLNECYTRVFDICGRPSSVLDIACGMNPLSFYLLGMAGIRLASLDAGRAVADVLNRFFSATGMAGARAEAGDALQKLPEGRFGLALVLKFLPLTERMERGGALRLLNAIDADCIVASFPTRSLSGRNVGMEQNYSRWLEGLGLHDEIAGRFVCGEELFYILKKR